MILLGPTNLLNLTSKQATKYFCAYAHDYIRDMQIETNAALNRIEYYLKSKYKLKTSIYKLLHSIINNTTLNLNKDNGFDVIINSKSSNIIDCDIEKAARIINYGEPNCRGCNFLQILVKTINRRF